MPETGPQGWISEASWKELLSAASKSFLSKYTWVVSLQRGMKERLVLLMARNWGPSSEEVQEVLLLLLLVWISLGTDTNG